MITPEIGNRDISFWWVWRNSSLEMALFWAKATGYKAEPVSDERVKELLDYFSPVEDKDDE